jgi:two-component system sensor histidine kinase PhcS
MSSATQPNFSKPLLDAYDEFLTNLRLRQAKICSILCLVLVPLCGGLDYFVYPELFASFMAVRFLHDLVQVPCLGILFTEFGRRHIRLLDDLWSVPPTLGICWMIYASEGVFSPYYAGLNLVVIGGCLIVPYSTREAMKFCGFVILCYVTACTLNRMAPMYTLLSPTTGHLDRVLLNNLYFLTLTCVICCTACHYAAKRRFHEFRLNYDLDQNNVELATTIDKLKKTEVQLVQSEKMNALGKLSAGLLHEINNPLNFTFMALEVAQMEAGDDASMKETLADIGQGMGRIRGVIADLRAFAYPAKHSDASEFSLEESLTTAMRLTSQEVRDIPIDATAIRGLRARGVTSQVMHVFMNLLVNAAHAIRSSAEPGRGAIVITCTPHRDRLRIAVRDNGAGVAPEHLSRLFEPFFTTKQPGEGTGLGLSICHTIIENHGGTMSVKSELGRWTEVSFDLGAVAAQREAA